VRRLLAIAATAEALTGLGLFAIPSVVVRLLLNAEIVGGGVVAGRVAGIALIALGISCWPTRDVRAAAIGMLVYSVIVTIYLGAIGLGGEMVGVLLWPAIAIHGTGVALMSIGLYRLLSISE